MNNIAHTKMFRHIVRAPCYVHGAVLHVYFLVSCLGCQNMFLNRSFQFVDFFILSNACDESTNTGKPVTHAADMCVSFQNCLITIPSV